MSIRDAAIKEFIKVPFEKVSINQIIQNAEISRGSFYTYFEDKRDVLSFIFEDMKEKAQKLCMESLEQSRGDFWTMMNALLEYGIEYCAGNDVLQLLKNTVQFQDNMGLFAEDSETEESYKGKCMVGQHLYDRVDKTGLDIFDMDDFLTLLDMGMANLMIMISRYYQNPEDVEELRLSFHKRMKILRYGIEKNA